MAAVVSPWTKPGAWALDSEENEADLLQQQKSVPAEDVSAADFPSLAAAAATKPQKKKKKGQTVSLAEFSAPVSFSSKPVGLTHEDLLVLPTGPRERSAEELDRNRLGGGFRSYGSGRYGDDSSNSRRGGFDDSRRREPPPSSRADEIDDWGASKKPIGNGFERRETGGAFFSSQSKADELDNWTSNKSSESRRFSNGGGADFARERRGFRGGYEGLSNGSGADADRWGKRTEDEVLSNNGSRADLDRWGKKEDEGSSTNSLARPKLVLQPRTLPIDEASGGSISAKPNGANPFGDARPREEVLKEKGQDWKEIEEKLENLKINEAERGEKGASSFGRRGSFGSGSSRSVHEEDKTEKSWRKRHSESVEATAARPSAGKDDNAGVEGSSV
ncbi:hypothetical protein SAY87_007325 [Trapa incisa]|uniref:Eukaryotic translation initiation factor 4B3 n=1 Tax=Trapa incisa TaxID=236973 RepID=A0AAN7JXP8_9MYRT|nr:hypothetical protein SAY87_007325 [Trapa incisa]